MKYYICIGLSLSLFLSCGRNEPEDLDKIELKESTLVQQELSDLTQKLWVTGYPSKDTSLVSDLLHEEFHLVDDEGSVFSKTDELAYVYNYGDQYQSFSYEIENIWVYEKGVSVLIAKCKFSGSDDLGAFATEYKQSITFSQVGNSWKIIASQVSGVEETRL